MKSRRHHAIRLLPLVALLSTLLTPAAAPTAPPAGAAAELSPLTAVRPEVRLRKLHLVRPDLIPYPIASEIWC